MFEPDLTILQETTKVVTVLYQSGITRNSPFTSKKHAFIVLLSRSHKVQVSHQFLNLTAC